MLFYQQREPSYLRNLRYRIFGMICAMHVILLVGVLLINTLRVTHHAVRLSISGAPVIFGGPMTGVGLGSGNTGMRTGSSRVTQKNVQTAIKPGRQNVRKSINKVVKRQVPAKKSSKVPAAVVKKESIVCPKESIKPAATLQKIQKSKEIPKKVEKKVKAPVREPVKAAKPEIVKKEPVQQIIESKMAEPDPVIPVNPVEEPQAAQVISGVSEMIEGGSLSVVSGPSAGLSAESYDSLSMFEQRFADAFNRCCGGLAAYQAYFPAQIRFTVGFDGARKIEAIDDIPPAAFARIKEALMKMELLPELVGTSHELHINA